MMKTLSVAVLVAVLSVAAPAATPPDYNPATAKTITVSADFSPSSGSTAAVPPDYNPATATTIKSGSSSVPPDYSEDNSMTVHGTRPDLTASSPNLTPDEQIELIKRNEDDIKAKKAARAKAAEIEAEKAAEADATARKQSAAAERKSRAAAATAKEAREAPARKAADSELEFKTKLNQARAARADEYVDAELEGLKKGGGAVRE